MTLRPKVRNSLLAAALAASVASAWATYSSSLIPAPAERSAVGVPAETSAQTTPLVNDAELVPNEAIVTADGPEVAAKESEVVVAAPGPAPSPVAVPVYERSEPAIEITRPRLTIDQRIQADVMDVLARNPNLSGKIGVVSDDAVVTLTGYTATSGQAWRAGRDARGVPGVRNVVNEIRPRVGGIMS